MNRSLPGSGNDDFRKRPGQLGPLGPPVGRPACRLGVQRGPAAPDLRSSVAADGARAGLATLVGPEREDELKRALVEGLGEYRRADGSFRLENEYRFLIARS